MLKDINNHESYVNPMVSKTRRIAFTILIICCMFNIICYVIYVNYPIVVMTTIPHLPVVSMVNVTRRIVNRTSFNAVEDYRLPLQQTAMIPSVYFGDLDESDMDLEEEEEVVRQEGSDDDDFLMNQQDLCHKEGGYVRLIIVVTCSVDVFTKRTAIRETWGSYTKRIDMGVRVAFLTGWTSNKTLQRLLEEENEIYHDIIQGNFLDTYRNLTLKSILLQKWIATYCSSAQYGLKADDDMFVHVPNLLAGLRHVQYPRFFFCSLQVGASPIRNKKSKWFVPKGEFPQGRYPNYCSGSAYSFSVNIAADLYSKSKETPVFWLEDIYITGILAKKVGMRHVHHKGFQFWKMTIGKPCSFKRLITSHRVSPSELRSIWKALHQPHLKC